MKRKREREREQCTIGCNGARSGRWNPRGSGPDTPEAVSVLLSVAKKENEKRERKAKVMGRGL